MTRAIKDKMLAEVKADLERVRSALRLVIITHDAAQTATLPEGLKGHVQPDQFRAMHDELLADAIAKARAELSAPTWLDRILEST